MFLIFNHFGHLAFQLNLLVNPLLHNSTFFTPLKYHVFENIMENGVFWSKCSIFHNIFKSIQNLT